MATDDIQTINWITSLLYKDNQIKPEINNYKDILDTLNEHNHEYYENLTDINKFKNYVENVLKKQINNTYSNETTDRDYKLDYKMLTSKNINRVFKFINEKKIEKKIEIFKKFNECKLYPKHKSGDKNKPENYRYLTDHLIEIKLIDRIIKDIIYVNTPKNIINTDIFKAEIFSGNNKNMDSCCDLATKHTESTDNVVLLDIKKAFDSVAWDKLYYALNEYLSFYMNSIFAKSIIDLYIIVLVNRKFYYKKYNKSKKNEIKINIGISQGLPSSNLIFTLFLSHIVKRWKIRNIIDYSLYFILHIYIDDIFIKLYNKDEKNSVIYLIDNFKLELKEYKLDVNIDKCLADKTLELIQYKELNEIDTHLGIFFTRNKEKYSDNLLIMYKDKHINKINKFKLNATWIGIYNVINNNEEKDKNIRNHLVGYFKYKLKPLIKYYSYLENENKLTNKILLKYMRENLINKNKLYIKETLIKNTKTYVKLFFIIMIYLIYNNL
jgi:hypothetical protein